MEDCLANFGCNKVILDSRSFIGMMEKYPSITVIIKNESS